MTFHRPNLGSQDSNNVQSSTTGLDRPLNLDSINSWDKPWDLGGWQYHSPHKSDLSASTDSLLNSTTYYYSVPGRQNTLLANSSSQRPSPLDRGHVDVHNCTVYYHSEEDIFQKYQSFRNKLLQPKEEEEEEEEHNNKDDGGNDKKEQEQQQQQRQQNDNDKTRAT
ncbi:hypothetical protein RFI_04473, partial [Reticulomyxa filosa]